MKVCPKCTASFSDEHETCPKDGSELTTALGEVKPGQIFAGHYEILSVLGRGGMSIVYKAKHRLMDRIVAIKLLQGETDTLALERFKQEAKAASSLNHPNIIAIYDFGIIDNQAYLVMDCLEGKTLADVLDDEVNISQERTVNLFRQACMGLEHAHKNGIVHRDLKPGNLCLVKDERGKELLKIVDFGIAKLVDNTSAQLNLTQTGEIFGSPLYMSPEQCMAKQLDQRSDIYSLGCVMYECLVGRPPLRGDTAYETMTMHVSKAPDAFIKSAPNIPINPSIEAIVFRCLEKKPEDRYQTVAEILSDMPTIHSESGSIKIKSVVHPTKQKREIKNLRYAFWGLFTFVAIVFSYMSCDNGPENDRGTVLLKTFWNAQTTLAQTFINVGWYSQAKLVLDSAEKIAREHFSNKARLLTALNMERVLSKKARWFEELQVVDDKITEVNKHILLEGYDKLYAELEDLADNPSEAKANVNRIMAPYTMDGVRHLVIGLEGNGLERHAIDLLLKAKEVLVNLMGPEDPLVADANMLLCDCYYKNQQLQLVRPLLSEAHQIYVKSGKDKAKIVISLLKLGEYDRDENHFEAAKEELEEAHKAADAAFAANKYLQFQYLNSYADYLTQTGRKEEAKAFLDRAAKIGPVDQYVK